MVHTMGRVRRFAALRLVVHLVSMLPFLQLEEGTLHSLDSFTRMDSDRRSHTGGRGTWLKGSLLFRVQPGGVSLTNWKIS